MTDILEKLDCAWNEDFKANLMHYCDLAAQEIRKLRKDVGTYQAEVVHTQDELGALLHAAEAKVESLSRPGALAQGSGDCGKPVAAWLWACTGCGSQMTVDQIKGDHPGALSCCPERRMAPFPSTHSRTAED